MPPRHRPRHAARAAFTILELLLVLVILGILAGIVAVRFVGAGEDARIKAAENQIGTFKTALKTFQLHTGRFPTTSEGLEALIVRPTDIKDTKWQGPYLDATALPKDAWDNAYGYRCPPENGVDFDIWSNGPDGKERTEDDVTSWNVK